MCIVSRSFYFNNRRVPFLWKCGFFVGNKETLFDFVE